MDAVINVLLIFAFPIMVFAVVLVIAIFVYAAQVIKEPLKAARELDSRPVGSITREEASLSIGRFARAAASICQLAFGLVIAGLVVCCLAALLVATGVIDAAAMAKSLSEEGTNLGSLMNIGFEIYLFWLLKRFFGSIGANARPFELERARELGKVGKTLLYMGFIPGVVGNLLSLVMQRAGLLAAAEFPSEVVLNGDCLVLGLCVCLLARIFEYGCILQAEDDGLV